MNHKYRKKPVVIEAFHFTEDNVAGMDWPEWLVSAYELGETKTDKPALWKKPDEWQWMCGTLEGPHEITFNDWIIQGVQGEIYPCKPDIFEATYEPVT